MKANMKANKGRWPNVVLMLAHRLRRWLNIKITLVKRPAFSGKPDVDLLYPTAMDEYETAPYIITLLLLKQFDTQILKLFTFLFYVCNIIQVIFLFSFNVIHVFFPKTSVFHL